MASVATDAALRAGARRVCGCPTLRVRGSGLCARFAGIENVRIPTLKGEGLGTRKIFGRSDTHPL